MKLLILGGTVFLSKKVAETAVAAGHEVTVVSRGVSGPPPEGVEHVVADRDIPGGLVGLAGRSFDSVVDVTCLPGQAKHALETLAAATGHWVYVSSCSVYADTRTRGQTVETGPALRPAPDDALDPAPEEYGASKVACENLVLASKPDAMIARAGLIVGPGDPTYRFGYWPDRLADGGEVLAPGTPHDPVQYIDVADLAEWLLYGAESGLAGVFDAVCPPMTRAAFLAAVGRGVGVEPDLTWVPQDFLLERDVAPWSGEHSLGLWLPLPDYAGFLSHDAGAAAAAGLVIRPLEETASTWSATRPYRPSPGSSNAENRCLSRGRESTILGAWHDSARRYDSFTT